MASQYETDFYAWTQIQSDKLRHLMVERSNLDLDLENIAEEVDSMGRSFRNQLGNRLTNLIEHLLKLAFSTNSDPRRQWELSVKGQRVAIKKLVRKNPSLRPLLSEEADDSYPEAIGFFDDEMLAELGMPPLPETCPFDLESQILNDEWLPEPAYR